MHFTEEEICKLIKCFQEIWDCLNYSCNSDRKNSYNQFCYTKFCYNCYIKTYKNPSFLETI